jgi:hypothetical protein
VPSFTRACALAVVVAGALSAASAVPAAAKMYVSTSSAIDAGGAATGHVEGYAVVSGASVSDTFQLDVKRGGVVVATGSGVGYVQLTPFLVAAGDELVLTDVTTTESHSATYTGAPALDASVCGAAATFSGLRDAGATASVSAALTYGAADARNDVVPAVKVAAGGATFSGSFAKPLTSAWAVTAQEGRSIDAGFSVFSDITRPVGDCPPVPVADSPPPVPAPAAPAPPAPVPDLLAPGGKLGALKLTGALKALLAGTFADVVTITEPGTVTQTLYLDDGAPLPKATAAAAAAKKPTVLATGRAVAGKPGTVAVKVKLSNKGKTHFKRRTTAKVALVTVVTDRAGNARVLAPKRFIVRRGT